MLVDEITAVVENIKSKRQEIVGHSWWSVDLNSTKQGNLSITVNVSAALGNNLSHEFVFGVKESIREFSHGAAGSMNAFSMREEHVSNKVLLRIQGVAGRSALLDFSVQYLFDVAASCRGTSAAGTCLSTSSSIDRSNLSRSVDSDVRTVDNKTRASVRDVMSHGSETSNSSKRKASEATHGEIRAKDTLEILFERSVHFVAAEGSSNQRVISVVVASKVLLDIGDEFCVCLGTRKRALELLSGHREGGRNFQQLEGNVH
jgi:hypothetical protein